jgi:hypothetical protein
MVAGRQLHMQGSTRPRSCPPPLLALSRHPRGPLLTKSDTPNMRCTLPLSTLPQFLSGQVGYMAI